MKIILHMRAYHNKIDAMDITEYVCYKKNGKVVTDVKTNMENLIEITDTLERKVRAAEVVSWNDIQYALDCVTEEKDKGLYGMVCYYTAFYMINDGSPDECQFYLNESIRCIQGTERESEIARCYNLSGIVAHSQGNFVQAMENYEKARHYAGRYGSRVIYTMAVGNMASTYYRVGAYDRSVVCYEECIQMLEESGRSTVSMANMYSRILAGYGYCLSMMGQIDKATAVAEKLQMMLDERDNSPAVRLAIYTFYAFLAYRKGDTAQEERCIDMAVRNVAESVTIFTDYDSILNFVQYLIQAKRLDALQCVLDYTEPQAASERNESFLLQLLLLRLRYCSDEMDQQNFFTCIQTFFGLKSKHELAENDQVMRVISLRNKLREVEEEQAKLVAENTKLLYQTEHDELSGLYNKRYLNRYMEEIFEEALEQEIPLGVLFVDIDYFKQMNDRYGHQKGDKCIIEIAKAIKSCMPGDFAARYGGDEFVILTLGRSRAYLEEKAQMLVEDIKSREIPNEDSKHTNIVTVTVGAVHAIPHKPNKMWDFLSAADETLYYQKSDQKGRVRFYNGQGDGL